MSKRDYYGQWQTLRRLTTIFACLRNPVIQHLRISHRIVATICVALTVGCGSATHTARQSPAATPHSQPDATIDTVNRLVEAQANALQVPALAIGVIRDGQLVSAAGYGSESAAQRIDAKTVFRLGSITKVFTAAAILHLRDEGKLTLDDPVAHHLSALKPTLSPTGREPVRIRHLLRHSSGIPTLGDGTLNWTTNGPPITQTQLIDSIANATLAFTPGTKTEYSNAGVALAGLIVAHASGIPYRNFINNKLLAPLGMSATKWDRDHYSDNVVFPGYVRDGRAFSPPENYWVMGAAEAAGGLYSTLSDMARFLSFQANPDPTLGVLTTKSVRESQTQSTASTTLPMGIGWVVEQDPGLGKVVWHNGATYAYSAWAGIDPKRNNGAILFASTGDLSVLAQIERIGKDVLRILADVPLKHTHNTIPKRHATDPTLVKAVAEAVTTLINAPQTANYHQIFSTQFLQQQPAERLQQFLTSTNDQIGTCSAPELVTDAGNGEFKLKLSCAKANIYVSLVAQKTPPYLLEGLLIKPAP